MFKIQSSCYFLFLNFLGIQRDPLDFHSFDWLRFIYFLLTDVIVQKVITSNDEENLKLFVLCCLTLAWKMRIRAFNVEMFLVIEFIHFIWMVPMIIRVFLSTNLHAFDFALSFQQEERKFQFDSNHVRIMELYILDALEWRMRSLTAICFSGYFIQLISHPPLSRYLKPQFVYQIIIRAQAGFIQIWFSIIFFDFLGSEHSIEITRNWSLYG